MTRLLAVLAAALLFDALPVQLSSAATNSGKRPRYVVPNGGKPGHVELDQYFEIKDPQQAAQLLIEESSIAHVDIDERVDSPERPTVYLGRGSVTPRKNDRRLFERASSFVSSSKADSEFICILKLSREPTIRELAHFMEMGVRFYRSTPYYSYFVRMSAATAVSLQGAEPVQWMGELQPSDKYPPEKQFKPGLLLVVETLVGDEPFCRADLKALGGEVMGFGHEGLYEHRWAYYDVRIGVDKVAEIASLWWVQAVNQEEEQTTD